MPATILKRNGITLTELLVSSILIGIVMIGVASFGVSISNIHNSTNRAAVLTMRTNAVMARIVRDADLAVGNNENCGQSDATLNCGWGVRTWSQGTSLSICFRQDIPGTAGDYTDDTYRCYYRRGGGPNRNLMLCGDRVGNIVKTQGGGGVSGCNTPPDRFLLALDPADDIFFNVVQGPNNSLDYIEITLSTRWDPTIAVHSITNPNYTITTRVSPIGHSK